MGARLDVHWVESWSLFLDLQIQWKDHPGDTDRQRGLLTGTTTQAHALGEAPWSPHHEIKIFNSVLPSRLSGALRGSRRGDVSVMAKDANGKFFVFAAADQAAKVSKANMKITFRLAGGHTGPPRSSATRSLCSARSTPVTCGAAVTGGQAAP
jgi:hypothetical protein